MKSRYVFACGLAGVVGIIEMSSRALATPNCDGSTPKSSLCGTATACDPPEQIPETQEWHCPNDAIIQQFIQHECNPGPGTGSTLCGPTEQMLVCTKRRDCEYAEFTDPETGEITSRTCAAAITGGVNNSTATKKDYILCIDTSG